MKARTFTLLLATTWLTIPVGSRAQDVPELRDFTIEQRWERAASQLSVSWVAALAYAKSVGQSVDEYADFCVAFFAPGWGEPGSGSVNIVRGMQRNYMMFPETEFELVEASATSVTARVNHPWARYFGEDRVWYGITQDEFERVFQIFNRGLSEHLGLDFSDRTEGDWYYMTFAER